MLDVILRRRTRPQNTKIEMSWGRRAANDLEPQPSSREGWATVRMRAGWPGVVGALARNCWPQA